MANFLDTPTIQLLERGLDVATLRQRVSANNLANVDTPGYKRQEVSFEDDLAKALRQSSEFRGLTSDPRHIPIGDTKLEEVTPRTMTINGEEYRNDGNNVDVDREMAIMAKNTLWYDAMISRVSGKLATLKNTIREVR